jgi:hypothetical protein
MRRLLRIEARRNALLPLLPLLLVLLWLTPIVQHLEPVALWPDRSTDLQSAIHLIGPFTAAAAAWMASRERRRLMEDLLASTPRSLWKRWMVTWTATCGWSVLFYVVVGAVLFSITALQATWGHLVIWPALSGLASLIVCSILGFAAGRLAPSRVTTPLAGIGVVFAMTVAMESALHGQAAGLLSPLYPSIGLESSVFYAIRPDLALVQIICYLGVGVAAFGLVTFRSHGGDRVVRRCGVALAAAGLTLVTAAVGLVSTSHRDGQGVIVPALHDAATDRAIPFTPVCTHSPLPVCMHPAYAHANELTAFDTTVNKIAAPLVGTPGLPIRAEQLPGGDNGNPGSGVEGNPPTLRLPHFIVHGNSIEPSGFAADFRTRIALALVTTAGTVPANKPCHCRASTGDTTSPAQRALALYLLRQAGYTPTAGLIPDDAAVTAAARRLTALTPTARHSWLTTRMAALRAGTLSLTEFP